MDLFGCRKRTFQKNSKTFIKQLNALSQFEKFSNEAQSTIKETICQLEDAPFPERIRRKSLMNIDKQIANLIEKTAQYAQQEDFPTANEYISIIFRWVKYTRPEGFSSEKILDAEEKLAVIKGSIIRYSKRMEELLQIQKMVIDKEKEFVEGSPQWQLLNQEWSAIEEKKKFLQRDIDVLTAERDYYTELLKNYYTVY